MRSDDRRRAIPDRASDAVASSTRVPRRGPSRGSRRTRSAARHDIERVQAPHVGDVADAGERARARRDVQGVAAQDLRRRVRRAQRPDRVRRPGPHVDRGSASFQQETARYEIDTGVFSVGLAMVVPTLLAHGTEEQKQRHVPALLRGDAVWCQLFSEPGAGSDLAGLTTQAVRDGDEWVVNGQKVWNSFAHIADWGILLARTDWDVPKHRGITLLPRRHDDARCRGAPAASDHRRRALQRDVPRRMCASRTRTCSAR